MRIAENTLKILSSSFTGVQIDPIKRMQATDKELLIACRQGSESSWASLVERYQRLVYAVPRRAGLNEDQASEVFQEVFVTLFEKMNEINEPDRLHAWLVTTARRKTWRWLSKDRSRQSAHTDEDDEALVVIDDSPLPDETLVRLEEQYRIRKALAGLDPRCQKLLTMLYYQAEPPSYSEIAAILGTPEGSIGPTRARCLKKLLKLLGE
ncbi:MAG TPA: sigma-70 family RNA polymerase sigma factor [Pyrinomonadaceae bacterium]|nr:sigma-70 family RNA polymerase sigma factor [Pyrinomonadaceae bacterium]